MKPIPISELPAILAKRVKREIERSGIAYRRATPEMNRTEERYAEHLDDEKLAGVVRAYWFKGIKLRLATRTSLEPDFLVQTSTGALELHEVKGHWEDDARAKIKIAAALFPCFRFVAAIRAGKRWRFETWL